MPTEFYQLKNYASENPNCLFIVKPEGGSQGRGIYITKKVSSLANKKKIIVQKYEDQPYCIDGYKFDLRLYVLVTCLDPLKILFFKGKSEHVMITYFCL